MADLSQPLPHFGRLGTRLALHQNARFRIQRKRVRAASYAADLALISRRPRARIAGNYVRFNIKGNDYRLVAAIDYRRKIVFIKWLGRHADYDKIDARNVEYGH
jgi:mRNA-degrading endonuclease HigB of HigAB toxin-antitoxin module